MADFDAALKVVLSHEGGWQAITSDAGNAGGRGTNRGITWATLEAWRKSQKLPPPKDNDDIKRLTLAETAEIYRHLYWKPTGAWIDDQATATVLFDAGVVMGPGTVVRIAQQVAAGASNSALLADGMLGPKTAAVINGLPRRPFLEPLCYRLQGRFLDCIAMRPDNLSWERVWMRRACDWLCLIY